MGLIAKSAIWVGEARYRAGATVIPDRAADRQLLEPAITSAAGLRSAPRNGFVLLTAIWLLVLASAAVALVMLRARSERDSAARDLADVRAQRAIDSAIDTVLAERLIDGPRGRWGSVPARAEVVTPEGSVSVRVSSESGRLDVNAAEWRSIEALLQNLGADSAARARVGQALGALNGTSRRAFTSIDAAVAVITAAAPQIGDQCLGELITVNSGRSLPEPGQMPPIVAKALGQSGIAVADPQIDAALRIEARVEAGGLARLIVRTTPIGPDGTLRFDFTRHAPCGG